MRAKGSKKLKMKQSTVEMLCCPLCKGGLELRIETKSNQDVTEGSLVCSDCHNRYLIRNGIPRMYVPDNEIIALSDNENFSKFIITPESLDKWIKNSKTRKQSIFLTNHVLTKFLVLLGWISLFFGAVVLILSSFNSHIAIPLLVVYLLIGISITFFVIDYLRYRIRAQVEYSTNLRTLKELSDKQQLSEYDIRSSTKDREEDLRYEFEAAKDFSALKGKRITSILDNYNFRVKSALNLGCGGELHKLVSRPYFDKGYDMIGVDISEEYLAEFSRVFSTDVVQTNTMALPFGSNNFDLVSFTDIVEHLHHPLLGLIEAQRVLRAGGVIILTTNNHCAGSFECINPFVFLERVIGLHYDWILPPRNMVERWMNFNFYHTEFSKNEITRLMRAAGFEILSLETYFIKQAKLNKTLKRLPALRLMGTEFMIVGRKKQSRSKNIPVETVNFFQQERR